MKNGEKNTMKYVAPDYESVLLSVKDVFAAYGDSGCPHDMYTSYTTPCTSTDPNYVNLSYLDKGWERGCYSVYNP